MTTEAHIVSEAPARGNPRRSQGRRASSASGRLTVALFSLAAFLVVLALLASQLRASTGTVAKRPVVVIRRIYKTKVIVTVAGGSGRGGTSVSQSVSSSGPVSTAGAAPTTRTS